ELGCAEARPRSRVLTPGRRPRSQPSIHTLACLCDINHHLHPLLPCSPIALLYPKLQFISHSAPRPPQPQAAPSYPHSLTPRRSVLLHRAGSTPDMEGHGLIGKRLVCESANCWHRCSSFVAACARPWLPPQDPMTVRSPIPSRWSRPQTRRPGLRQSTTYTSQKVFSVPPGRPTESKSYSPVTLLAAPICGK